MLTKIFEQPKLYIPNLHGIRSMLWSNVNVSYPDQITALALNTIMPIPMQHIRILTTKSADAT